MFGNKFFINLDKVNEGSIMFGDGSKAKICGKCTICAPRILKLSDALFMDGLKANIISLVPI